jgi:hypothetical protein
MSRFRTTRWATKPRVVLLAVVALASLSFGLHAYAASFLAPTITLHPSSPTTLTSASFTFTNVFNTRFQCSLDGSAFTTCGTSRPSTKSYPGPLAVGSHTFKVRAAFGSQMSSATSFSWTINANPPPKNDRFTIAGNACCLYPGVSHAIPVALSNPNGYAIQVNQLTIGLSSSPYGCNSSWITFQQSSISSSHTVTVPAFSTVNLASSEQPHIQLIESGTNQDACKTGALAVHYDGTAIH